MKKIDKLAVCLASFFGVGFIPKAPGTFGSLAGLAVWIFFMPEFAQTQIIAVAACTVFSIIISARAATALQIADDKRIVIDEVCGMWFALMLLPKTLVVYIAAFVLFRFFDIKKPFFINSLQVLQNGLGITFDDVAAGIVTNVIIRLGILAGSLWI
jgi:phosphatidylglycerophosphatase A